MASMAEQTILKLNSKFKDMPLSFCFYKLLGDIMRYRL